MDIHITHTYKHVSEYVNINTRIPKWYNILKGEKKEEKRMQLNICTS